MSGARLPFVLLPDGKDQFSVPPVGVLRETGTLHPFDAEALAGGRLHDHPALQVVSPPWRLVSPSRVDFSRDVVGLMSIWTRFSWSARWICTIGSLGGVSSMR